ncbi:MAG: Ig-like domain-containing protein [Gemmatimonadaceae bacterium]
MTRLNVRHVALVMVAMLLVACGGTTEPAKVSTVTVSPASSTKSVGETVQLTATTVDAAGNPLTGRTVTWSSSNTSAATVSNTGLVTAVAANTVTITATSEGISGTASVIVIPPPVATVAFSTATLSVVTGRTLQLAVTTSSANGSVLTGRTITYTSSTPTVATVSALGVVSGVNPGTTTLTATSEGKVGTATLTVTFGPCDSRGAATLVTGQVVTGSLANTDCALTDNAGLPDGTYFDIYKFVVPTTTTVDITLRSTAFDAYLFLLFQVTDSTFSTVGQSDDEGGGPNGTDARLAGLAATPGTYFILPNSFPSTGLPSPFGAYTLSYVSPYVAGTIRAGDPLAPTMSIERVTDAQARSLRNLLVSRRAKRP